ncbi:hypothetical protein WJX73_006967 [Symbiochloris irregularis]|uniref:Leucine-rich repeat-containing N-terminal plant-type domain-containing protein n=1 Tax=Symbiochloris irregularis TaxID=706552 RepID=A0AAW1NWJ5_9CHLO
MSQLTGVLPPEWGTDSAFPHLEFLTISNGSSSTGTFGGQLPSQWGTSGGLPSLRYLFLDRNHFSGTLPDSWGRQLNLSWLDLGYNVELIGLVVIAIRDHDRLHVVLAGMCGSIPEGVIVLNALNPSDSLTSLPFPECDWEASLVAFAGSIKFRSKSLSVVIKGWYVNDGSVDDVPFCEWTGVSCDNNNTIIGLDMAARGLNGTLEHGLEGLTTLQTLNLSANDLGGTLSKTWNFPEMSVLNLSALHISGTLPEGGLRALAIIELSYNAFNGLAPLLL